VTSGSEVFDFRPTIAAQFTALSGSVGCRSVTSRRVRQTGQHRFAVRLDGDAASVHGVEAGQVELRDPVAAAERGVHRAGDGSGAVFERPERESGAPGLAHGNLAQDMYKKGRWKQLSGPKCTP